MKLLYIPLDYQRHESDDTLFGDFLRGFQAVSDARIFTDMRGAIEFRPEVVFFQGSLTVEDLVLLKEKTGAKIVMWTGDCRYAPTKSLMDYKEIVDLYLLPFSGGKLIEYYALLGKPCEYLYEPIQDWRFKEPKELKTGNIVFVGNHYGNFPGGESRTEIIKFLNAHLRNGIEVYGNIGGSRGEIPNKDVPALYNNAYAVICENNIHDVDGYFTPRNIGAKAAGTCPLFRHYEGHHYGHLQNCLSYRHKYELLDYIVFLYQNPDVRNKIAKRAYLGASEMFKAKNWAEKAVNIIKRELMSLPI